MDSFLDTVLKTFDLTRLDVAMIGVCCLLFVVLWSALEALLFRPYLKFLELREGATTGARGIASDKQAQVEKATADYSRRMNDARVGAMRDKLAALDAAKSEASRIIKDAEDKASEIADEAASELEKQTAQLRADATRDISTLVDMVVSKVKAPAQGSRAVH
jgi:F0F1-type ATP synthase membrane subunit b/b'